jgi:hypothetical protein
VFGRAASRQLSPWVRPCLPLRRIEPQFVGRLDHYLVLLSTTLSWFCVKNECEGKCSLLDFRTHSNWELSERRNARSDVFLRNAVSVWKLAEEFCRLNKIRDNENGSWLKLYKQLKRHYFNEAKQITLHSGITQHNAHFKNKAVLPTGVQTADCDVI